MRVRVWGGRIIQTCMCVWGGPDHPDLQVLVWGGRIIQTCMCVCVCVCAGGGTWCVSHTCMHKPVGPPGLQSHGRCNKKMLNKKVR